MRPVNIRIVGSGTRTQRLAGSTVSPRPMSSDRMAGPAPPAPPWLSLRPCGSLHAPTTLIEAPPMPNVLPFQARTSPVRFAQDVRDALAGLAYTLPVEVDFGACDDGDENASIGPVDGDDFAFAERLPRRDGGFARLERERHGDCHVQDRCRTPEVADAAHGGPGDRRASGSRGVAGGRPSLALCVSRLVRTSSVCCHSGRHTGA